MSFRRIDNALMAMLFVIFHGPSIGMGWSVVALALSILRLKPKPKKCLLRQYL